MSLRPSKRESVYVPDETLRNLPLTIQVFRWTERKRYLVVCVLGLRSELRRDLFARLRRSHGCLFFVGACDRGWMNPWSSNAAVDRDAIAGISGLFGLRLPTR